MTVDREELRRLATTVYQRRFAALAVLLIACTDRAPPMAGVCTEILPSSYTGAAPDGPTLSCLWRGHRWDCSSYSTGLWSRRWSCTSVGTAPAEDKR